jgi:hemerythrin-like domain-containing protein
MKPTEELKKEHQAIKLMLRIMEEVSRRLESGEKISSAHLDSILEFIQVFADRCHHGKEEGLLFPAMEEAGVPVEKGPLGVMLYEHNEGRAFVDGMTEALAKYRRGEREAGKDIARNARSYVDLLRKHIDKEDNILYPMADDRLSPETQEDLEKGFEKIERDVIGPGRHKEFQGLLRRLKGDYLRGL